MTQAIIVVGLDAWVADLQQSKPRLMKGMGTAVAVTSRKVQTAARKKIRGHRYLPLYPASITYDVRAGPIGFESEIGPDKGRPQGALGNLLEFGSIKNQPIPHLGPALMENLDDLVHGVEVAVHQALL